MKLNPEESYDEKKYPFDFIGDILSDKIIRKKKKKLGDRGSLTNCFELLEDELFDQGIEEKIVPKLFKGRKTKRRDYIRLLVLEVLYGLQERPSEGIALLALKIDGSCLRFIKNQTEKMCLVSVKSDWNNLKWVEKLTPEICSMAKDVHGSEPDLLITQLIAEKVLKGRKLSLIKKMVGFTRKIIPNRLLKPKM